MTAAIVGPRTVDRPEPDLAADGVELSSDLLDRIDETVFPGQTIDIDDHTWTTPASAASAPPVARPAAGPRRAEAT